MVRPSERLLLGQRRNGGAFVHAHRARLDHRLAMQDMHLFAFEQPRMLFHRRHQHRPCFRRQAIMQRQCGPLVFQQQPRNVFRQPGENLGTFSDSGRPRAIVPSSAAYLATMRADGRGPERREKRSMLSSERPLTKASAPEDDATSFSRRATVRAAPSRDPACAPDPARFRQCLKKGCVVYLPPASSRLLAAARASQSNEMGFDPRGSKRT